MDMEEKKMTEGVSSENTPPVTEVPAEPTQIPSAETVQEAPVSVTPDMGAPEHKAGGKRLAASSGKKRTALIAATAVMTLFLAGYLALCAVGNSEKSPLPNTHVAGVTLSGSTWEEAGEKLTTELKKRLSALSVDFVCEGKSYSVPGSAFTTNIDEVVAQLKNSQQGGNFLTRGGQYISALLGASDRNVKLTLGTMPQGVLQAVEDWSDEDAVTSYALEEDTLVFTKGRTGRTLDVAALLTDLEAQAMKAMAGEKTETVQVAVTTMPPAEPNFEAIRAELYTEVAEASFDPETGEILPSTLGRDLDVKAARAALEKTAEGEICRVELMLTEPEVSTETLTELLFRDVLGECTTYAYGTTSRRTNVRLSGEFANGIILMPGEEFSYANDCGPFTIARGFKAAPGYQGGKTIDMEGGGVCQTASTIYLAVLRSGLEVVERHAHGYEPAYVPAGLDATVAGTVLDFRFANNTDYPVKIEASMDEKYNLTVKLWGTNLTGTHWEPYTKNRVITQQAQTVYEPNESIPQGTLQKDSSRTAYNGISVDSYNKEVDDEGNVIQDIYLYRTKYKVRDAVIWYNPADADLWGIDPETGLQTREPMDPNATTEPGEETTEPGEETTEPGTETTEPQPGESQPPEVTESMPPVETDPGEVPVLPEGPVLPPENTPTPETTPTIENTPAPETTEPAPAESAPPSAENSDQPVG